jgi:hypothetical protein
MIGATPQFRSSYNDAQYPLTASARERAKIPPHAVSASGD